jgi:hypothetical protein
MNRTTVYLWVYALPFPVFAAMYLTWWAWSGSHTFAVYVMFLPVFYGYLGPGIATNLLHKWRFKGPWVIGNFYAHHGFKYASTMSPLLFVAFLGTPSGSLSASTVFRVLVCTATLHGFVMWLHDIQIVRHGMVEVFNRPALEGRSPEEIVTHYAPICFFLIGLVYALGALLAYHTFLVRQDLGAGTVLWIWLLGLALLLIFPTLAYRALEGKRT